MKNHIFAVGLIAVVVVLGYSAFSRPIANSNQNEGAVAASNQTVINSDYSQTSMPTEISTKVDVAPQFTSYTFTGKLSVNPTSEAVMNLQKILTERFYYEGDVTSVMDQATIAALKQFQADNKLQQTGTLGLKTVSLLNSISSPVSTIKDLSSQPKSSILPWNRVSVIKNSTYGDQNVLPQTVHFKIGSYTITNNLPVSSLRVTNLQIGITPTAVPLNDLSNLSAYDGAIQIGSTFSIISPVTNIAVPLMVIAPHASKVIDIYADFGASTSGSIQTNLWITAYKTTNNNMICDDSLSNFNAPGCQMSARSGQIITIISTQLSVGTIYGSSATTHEDKIVTVGTNNGLFLASGWTSVGEPQKITKLKLVINGGVSSIHQSDFSNIRLYAKPGLNQYFDPTAQLIAQASMVNCLNLSTCSYTWTAVGNLLPFTINPGSGNTQGATIWVKADVPTSAYLGEGFYMTITNDGVDVVANGSTTGTPPAYYLGIANSPSHFYNWITPFQVLATTDSPQQGTTVMSSIVAGTVIGRIKVTNNGSAPATLNYLDFTDNGSHTGVGARYTAYASSENTPDYTANTLEVGSLSDTVKFQYLTNPITINAGAYRYVTIVVTNVTGLVSGDTFSLSIPYVDDAQYSVTEAGLGYDGNQDGDQNDTITTLRIDGTPILGSVQKN